MSDDIHKHRSRSHSPSNHKHSKSKAHNHKHRSHRHKKSSKRSRSRSRSCSNSRSRSREYYKHKKPKKSKTRHKRSRSPSSSYSYDTSLSDNTDSSISSSSNYHKKHKKKSSKKKHHRHKSSKKKKRHKHKKKHKKHKKHKKSKNKNRDKTLLEGNLSIYKPCEYREGEHGFITANDLINKMPEFTCWLADIHGVAIDNLVKRDERKWFAKFCDDWNTSTMADDKYYDIDKWNKANGGGDNENMDRSFGISDEQRLNLEKRAARQYEQDRRYAARVQEMKKHLIDLKSHNKKEFESLTDQHIPRKETFESLAAKRKAKKVEDRVKRFGKYDTNVTWD